MSEIEEIKARLDIVDIVSENVQLKRSGKNYTGFCPFHANTRTPSFVVWPDTGTWRCFGECNDGGDIFKYVMKREGWDFPEALRNLAQRAGVELRPLTPQEEEQREENDHLRRILEEATTFFHHQLTRNPAGKIALDYLHERGLTDETIALFELGYAPNEWDVLVSHFQEKGYSSQDLVQAGLASERESGGLYDRFRHRVMFPIRDRRERMTGYGARALDPNERAKYLNSPQTPLFDKSALLYGMDKARRSIRSEDQVVIVEGYMDVIAPYQAGFTNLVSPMGTALTEAHLRQLKRLTRRIVLALDADAAGTKATLRGLQVARETLDRESEPVFDARGLLTSEARLQADIRVCTLPDDLDPDEVVLQDPALWKKLIDEAQPIVAHVMHTLAAGQDMDDPKVKTEIVQQVMPLIQDLPNAIERDTYTQQLARLIRVDERSLLAEQSAPRRTKRPQRRKPDLDAPFPPEESTQADFSAPQAAAKIGEKMEIHCLSMLMRAPEMVYRIDRALKKAGLAGLTAQDFQHVPHQEMFLATIKSLSQDHLEPVSFALEHIPFPLLEQAEAILDQSKNINPQQDEVLEDVLRTILRLRQSQLQLSNNQIRFMLEEMMEASQEETLEYQRTIQKNSQELFRIQKALGSPQTNHTR